MTLRALLIGVCSCSCPRWNFLRAQALSQATPVVKDAADTVAPYVKAGLQTASDVAGPALKAAEPVVQARIGVLCLIEGCNDGELSARYRPSA